MSASTPRLRRAWHLTKRFFGALVPGAPSSVDETWVAHVLSPKLFAQWKAMPGHDRRHSIGVARRMQSSLATTAHADDDQWLAAALLHDVGKLDADLGVFARVATTLARGTLGHERTDRWIDRRGWRLRCARYLRHDELGAARIRAVGGPEMVARWAAAHHDRSHWVGTGIPPEVVAALVAADDD